jgi:uncharacterized protein (DUF433 family)
MASSTTVFNGVVHGKTIELEQAPGLPDGQVVSVEIRPAVRASPPSEPAVPWWLDRLEVNPGVKVGKFVIKGTRLLVDELIEQLDAGRPDQELLRDHPELTPDDVAAVHEYAKLPVAMRRSFGAWAEDAEELDKYLKWTRQQRRASRRELLE